VQACHPSIRAKSVIIQVMMRHCEDMHETLYQLSGGLDDWAFITDAPTALKERAFRNEKVFAVAVCCLGISDVTWLDTQLIHTTDHANSFLFLQQRRLGRKVGCDVGWIVQGAAVSNSKHGRRIGRTCVASSISSLAN